MFANFGLMVPVLDFVIFSSHFSLRISGNKDMHLFAANVREAIFWGREILMSYLAGNYL